jgi:hypothetical protein
MLGHRQTLPTMPRDFTDILPYVQQPVISKQ